MNITELYNSYYDRSGEQPSNGNQVVATVLLHIIGHYITQWSNNFVLTLSCNREHTCVFYHDLFEKMFASWREWPVQIVNVQKSQKARVEGSRYQNMIFTESYESFLEADLNSYTRYNDYNEYYYIFLQQRDALLPAEMQKIFEYCWQHYLINCVVQTQSASGEVSMFTYFPFTEKHCSRVEVVQINRFNGVSLMHQELFPKKLQNLHGCPLRVATWHVPPYLYLSQNATGEWIITNGIEGLLLVELSKKLNFTLDIKIPENNLQRGTIRANGSLTGAIKMLHEHTVDLSIGSFRQTSERRAVATATINYYQSSMSLVALEDIFLLTSWQTLLFPFSRDSWCLLVAFHVLAISAVATLTVRYRNSLPKDISKSSLDMLLMLMGMPAIYSPQKTVTRILRVSWMVHALLIRTAYQALLYHIIRTHHTVGAPQNLDELILRGYSMVMNRQTTDMLENVPTLETINMINLNTSSENSPMEYLEGLSLKEAQKHIAAMPLDTILYYMQTKRKVDFLRIIPFDMMPFQICIYLTKHSFLIEPFEESLMWIQGSGLMKSWASRVLDRRYAHQTKARQYRLFGLGQLKLAFILLLVCHLVATVVFVIEMLCYKIKGIRILYVNLRW